MTLTAAATTATSYDLGPARALSCRECGHEIPLAPEFACPQCFGPLEVAYDFPEITRASIEAGPKSIWRYRQLLPVPTDVTRHPNTEPGLTRLIKADRLAAALGVRSLWVKDDTGNPTHSFKDRVVAVALAAARELGFTVLACPSTGNLANAVAAAAARAGWDSVVLIPSSQELGKLGLVEPTPYRVFGAQATGCSPVSQAFAQGHDVVQPVRPDTIARSLAIGNPADGPYVLDAVRRTGGAVADVSDEEVVEGIRLLARTEGVFAETAGGVTVATAKKLVETGQLDPDAETVLLITGDGLKTLDAVSGRVGPTATVPASSKAVREALAARGL